MRLIERESQLAALHQYANEASQGQGRLVLISGEAGVGKSVLLEELAEKLGEARWLWAGCDGLFTPAALGPLVDIANQINGSYSSFAALRRNETSCTAHCSDNSATCKLSPLSLLKTSTGPTRQRSIY
jgi:predicted ATPase